jgi:hypothetical protein
VFLGWEKTNYVCRLLLRKRKIKDISQGGGKFEGWIGITKSLDLSIQYKFAPRVKKIERKEESH